MRTIIHIALLFCILASSCKLERDNPLDLNNSDKNNPKYKPSLAFSRYTVSSDNNEDGKVNKGEEIGLQVFVKNNGGSAVTGVKAIITCISPYVTQLTPSGAHTYKGSSYEDVIAAGAESIYGASPSYSTVTFDVSKAAPDGTSLDFEMIITDETNTQWKDTFSVIVVASEAVMKYNRSNIVADDNNNGIANPGEEIDIQVFLRNVGTTRANKVKAVITCNSTYVSGLAPSIAQPYRSSTFDDFITAGSEGNYGGYPNSYTSTFRLSAATPRGTVLSFDIGISDESGNIWNDKFSITVQ